MKDQYLDFAWNETQYQGKTYALPFDTDARALWYNKDLDHGSRRGVQAQLDISKGPPTIDPSTRSPTRSRKKDADGNYT